ncbi:MAG: hypothetical protein JJE16_03675 [Nitrospiraceae bacterium]|nr:hypothetical protein [Nitrospiraceae bacterium]
MTRSPFHILPWVFSALTFSATMGRFLKTSFLSLIDCVLLLAVGTIPLVMLELVKVVRQASRLRKAEP